MREDVDVLTLIRERIPVMSKSHKKIAIYILGQYDEAAFLTAAKVGKAIGVSESTVVRFAMGLGFDGYPEFQKALGLCIKSKLTSNQKLDDMYGRNTQSEILTQVLVSDIEKLQHTLQHLNTDAFEAAVDMILEAETVYILGIRSCAPLASLLQFYLNMIRKNVVLLGTSSPSEIYEQMLRINDKDCFIGISFPRYSMRTLKAMEFANDKSARIISITDNVHSPMTMYSSCNLIARSDMVSIVDSLVAPHSLINALVVALCLRVPEQVQQGLKTFEEACDTYRVYENDEINFIDDEPMLDYYMRKSKAEDEE